MTIYTLTGHPLNHQALGLDATLTEQLRALFQINGVGATVTLTLAGGDDTKLKGHGILR